jgi:CheY-like chemotaxis protein
VERALSRYHDVAVSNSGRHALERIAAGERYDVIISDLMMPDITGMDLHGELSRLVPDQARRMVFLTGGAFSARAQAFLDVVPNAWLEKPFDLPDLLAIVARLL